MLLNDREAAKEESSETLPEAVPSRPSTTHVATAMPPWAQSSSIYQSGTSFLHQNPIGIPTFHNPFIPTPQPQGYDASFVFLFPKSGDFTFLLESTNISHHSSGFRKPSRMGDLQQCSCEFIKKRATGICSVQPPFSFSISKAFKTLMGRGSISQRCHLIVDYGTVR
ncbi:hypothetical protein ADUPG1_007026 [Aduncisulcus paluster]|uniref:Uncharacterized protein n=1 Tax=Aduncisulcus paluster TaxID=2918883 RepID=A0ABQ5KPW8_9EUKA|nr:hypothetical protein ADUPG1_007026 [Aduncisulcus paluster]